MKLKEQVKEIKRLMREATSSSNSGSYEAPLPVDAPEGLETIVSVEIMDGAPEVEEVDITMTDDVETCPTCGEMECPGHDDEVMDTEEIDLQDVFNSLGLFTETTLKEDTDLDEQLSAPNLLPLIRKSTEGMEDKIERLERQQSEDGRIHSDLNKKINDLESRVSKLEKSRGPGRFREN